MMKPELIDYLSQDSIRTEGHEMYKRSINVLYGAGLAMLIGIIIFAFTGDTFYLTCGFLSSGTTAFMSVWFQRKGWFLKHYTKVEPFEKI